MSAKREKRLREAGTYQAGTTFARAALRWPRRRRETGPTPKQRAAVLERDRYTCVRCGAYIGLTPEERIPYSIQHRIARGMGGSSRQRANRLSNLILLCGSATNGCHGEVEQRDILDFGYGYWLRSTDDPAAEPVRYRAGHHAGRYRYLDDNGGFSDA